MKKRVILCLLVGSLMASLIGCGSAETKETAATKAETEEAQTDEETGKNSRAEADETEEEKTEETEETKEKETKKGAVLGGSDAEGYEGFEYLYEEILMTETQENKETGKKERKSITVFIPDDEYARADGNYAYADSLGVNFKVELEPYLRYDADDYLPQENLDDYIANQYDPFYTADYKDLVITEAEEVGEDAVRCTVEYCRYDDWDEVYYTVFCTYYLKEFEDGNTVMVSIEINDANVTGKTPGLIEELEQFYEFEIDWDAQRAEEKRLAYAANETENTFSTGMLLFDLPLGWDEDDEVSEYENRVYAPEGDMALSGCMISIMEEYLGFDEELDINSALEENTKEALEEAFGTSIANYTAEVCETGIGEAAKFTFSISESGVTADIVMYIVPTDYNVYTLMSLQSPDATEDAAAVLDSIVENGQVREY